MASPRCCSKGAFLVIFLGALATATLLTRVGMSSMNSGTETKSLGTMLHLPPNMGAPLPRTIRSIVFQHGIKTSGTSIRNSLEAWAKANNQSLIVAEGGRAVKEKYLQDNGLPVVFVGHDVWSIVDRVLSPLFYFEVRRADFERVVSLYEMAGAGWPNRTFSAACRAVKYNNKVTKQGVMVLKQRASRGETIVSRIYEYDELGKRNYSQIKNDLKKILPGFQLDIGHANTRHTPGRIINATDVRECIRMLKS